MSARKLPITHFYTRRRKRKRKEPSFYNSLVSRLVKLANCNGDSENGGDEGEEEEVGIKFKEKQKRKVGNSKLMSRSVKLANLSNGNREDEGKDDEMVIKNKEKQKRKVDNSKLVPHSEKVANFSNGNREDEGKGKEMVIKSKDKQKRSVGDLKLVSHSVKLAFSNSNSDYEGETDAKEAKVVMKNKEKVERKVEDLELVNLCAKSERDYEGEDDGVVVVKHIKKEKKRRKVVNSELANLGVDANVISRLNESCTRETRNSAGKNKIDTNHSVNNCKDFNSLGNIKKRKENCILENHLNNKSSGSIRTKKWVCLSFEGVDPKKFIGLQCKVYWPLDADWYNGR